ncbi:Zinc finger protein [Toxocara canis]|uniref:Zinc finger protein n=1 Tax=Toxocara canis TaxID=6265 RepID=A0A0B2V9K3_TOXCA|nr:Zinc finger protein [Toxocara canis]
MGTLSTCSQDGSGSLNPMSFTDQHGSILLERLRYQRDTGRFCDVYLVVKDRRFSAHRNILAACSPYFDSIFKNSKVVKEQVTVNCQNPTVFELLLNYMYSGSVVIDRSSVTDLLKLANNFLVTKVKNYCAEYLDRYMDSSNCLTVKELALKYNLPALLKSACDFFDVNINRCLLESADIVEFSLAQLNALLSEPKYANAISPDVHLKLIVRWIGHNATHRDSLFKEMLACCPFSMVQPVTLEYLLDYSPFLANSLSSRFALLQAILIVRWIGHNATHRDSLFKEMLACCPFSMVQPVTLEYLLDYSPFLANSLSSRFALLQAMYEHSMPMAKYESQYRSLLAQFGGQVNMYFNDSPTVYAADAQHPNFPVSKVETQPSTSDLRCDEESMHDIGEEERIHLAENGSSRQIYGEHSGQPPVIGASTTEEVLNPPGSSEPARPSLKLKIQLNSLNLVNRKNRLLGKSSVASGRHKLYRKSVSTANQMLAKRRGRPPKARSAYVHVDVAHNEDELGEQFFPDCGVEISDQVIFDEEDEVDPLSQPDESEGEAEVEGEGGIQVEKPFKCGYCSYRGTTERRVKNHTTRAHGRDIVHMCSLCVFECRWNREYYSHMRGHFPGPPFHCDLCEYSADRIQLLLSHRLTHTDERPFKCTLCEYRCRSKSNLISHVRSHTGEKPFHCAECGRGFAIKSTLDQHLAAHSETRPFQCPHCDFSTKYQSHLISHRRIHSGDVFHCHYEDCTYSSPKKSQLAAHLRTHLAVRAHQCKICNRSFIEKSHLVRHERIHLEDKPFKCDNCDYASSRRDKLKEHIQKHHSSAATGKQHRRRYRRAKQLAQLAAQAKVQPNFDAMFRPIPASELLDNSSNSLPSSVIHPENPTEFVLSEMATGGNENQQIAAQGAAQPHSGPQQVRFLSLVFVFFLMHMGIRENPKSPDPCFRVIGQFLE